MKKFRLLGYWVIGFLGLLNPSLAYAQPVGPIGPVGPTQGVPIDTAFKTPFGNFGMLVSVIISNLYIIAGIVILFLVIFGGFGIISGAGSGDQQKTAQGKQALTSAIIGFLIIFTSYWIIQLIELITGRNILKPGF